MTTPEAPILIGYDRSEGARRAIEKTAELFPGKTAIVLHVWSPIAIMANAYGGMAIPAYTDEELQKAAATVAEEGCRLATAAGLHAKSELADVRFNTCHTILDVADEYDAGLIVVGARGLSAFRSFVLGSISHGVAQHSHRPVLVVPPAVVTDAETRAVKREGVTA